MTRKGLSGDIVLIDPPPKRIVEKHDVRKYPHLGLAYIAGYLRSKGIMCNIIDGKFERIDLQVVERRLKLLDPKMVGITSMTHEIAQAAKVAQIAKGISSEVVTVAGGPHATALPMQVLVDFQAFDIAVYGEGEYTFSELVRAIMNEKSLKGIAGIAYRTPSGLRQNQAREPIENLDTLPFPAWDLLPRSPTYPIITSRGCPFRCKFCMRVLGNKVRRRKPEAVINELSYLITQYNPKFIHFMDETFSVNKSHVHRLLDLMIENGLHRRVKWDAQTRADLVDYDLLLKMKAAGCEWIGLGIESGNEKMLKRSGKRLKLAQVVNAVKMAEKVGLKTDGFFIFGHPFETPRTVIDTINFATELNTTLVTFGTMVPYPGTEIYEMARKGQGGYKLLSRSWEDFNKNIGNSLELATLSRKQMEVLQVLGYLKFYLSNLRFVDGLQYLLDQKRLGFAIIKKILTRMPDTGSSKLELKKLLRLIFAHHQLASPMSTNQ